MLENPSFYKNALFVEAQKTGSRQINRFTLDALESADPKFWLIPSSSSGKYHPPEDQGEAGLIRHVLKCVAVTKEFGKRAFFTDTENAMATSAVILHDVCKNGIPWTEYTDFTHGLLASKWLEQFYLNDQMQKDMILSAVRYHMAPWCFAINPTKEKTTYTAAEHRLDLQEVYRAMTCPSRIELAVREADYWASRQDMSFMPGMPIAADIRHDAP